MDKMKAPPVSDEELSLWEQSSGEYLNRYDAKRLMFTVRDLRAKLTAAHEQYTRFRDHYDNTSIALIRADARLAASEADVRLLREALGNALVAGDSILSGIESGETLSSIVINAIRKYGWIARGNAALKERDAEAQE